MGKRNNHGNRNNENGRADESKNKRNYRPRNNRKPQQSKEVEENVDLASLNKQDLPHVITSAKTNNDPSWYTHIWPVVKDVASLPFNSVNGNLYNAISWNKTDGTNGLTASPGPMLNVMPGLMTIDVTPVLGSNDGPNSAVNIAAQQIYTIVRAANSGARNYDKTDMMRVILAMDSAYMLFEHLVRAYKLFKSYDYLNRYLPNGILYALGFGQGLGSELADFREAINTFAYKLASVNVPDQFDFIHRHSWMFTNIYKDSEASQSQMYAYKLNGIYIWTEGQNDQPSFLKYTPLNDLFGSPQVSSVDAIRSAIDKVMNPILGSEDVGIISGDLAKAIGANGMIKIQPIDENMMLYPVFDKEVLLQIMNSVAAKSLTIGNIVDVNTDLASGPYLSQRLDDAAFPWHEFGIKYLLNFIDTDTTPENILVATRLAFRATALNNGANPNGTQITHVGTEIVTNYTIWYTNTLQGGIGDANVPAQLPFGSLNELNASSAEGASTPTWVAYVQKLLAISAFDWHPTIYNVIRVEPGESGYTRLYEFLGYTQDVSDYLIAETSDIDSLNDVAVLSEYAVKDYKTALTK